VPVLANVSVALSRQRIAIEVPGNMDQMEREDMPLARRWRETTRTAFNTAVRSGFVVTEFCRSIRGQQGPGAYLLEKEEEHQILC